MQCLLTWRLPILKRYVVMAFICHRDLPVLVCKLQFVMFFETRRSQSSSQMFSLANGACMCNAIAINDMRIGRNSKIVHRRISNNTFWPALAQGHQFVCRVHIVFFMFIFVIVPYKYFCMIFLQCSLILLEFYKNGTLFAIRSWLGGYNHKQSFLS